jgi:hypothetical protein
MATQHLTSVGFFLTNPTVLPASPGFGNARIFLLLSSLNFVAGAAQAQPEAISGMPERGRDETRELLVGTWIGIALIAEILIQQGAARREDVVSALSNAEALSRDGRRIALTALRKLTQDGFAEQKTWPRCQRQRPPA